MYNIYEVLGISRVVRYVFISATLYIISSSLILAFSLHTIISVRSTYYKLCELCQIWVSSFHICALTDQLFPTVHFFCNINFDARCSTSSFLFSAGRHTSTTCTKRISRGLEWVARLSDACLTPSRSAIKESRYLKRYILHCPWPCQTAIHLSIYLHLCNCQFVHLLIFFFMFWFSLMQWKFKKNGQMYGGQHSPLSLLCI